MILTFVSMAKQVALSFPLVHVICHNQFCYSRTIFGLVGKRIQGKECTPSFCSEQAKKLHVSNYSGLKERFIFSSSLRLSAYSLARNLNPFQGLQFSIRRCFCSSLMFLIFPWAALLMSTCESSVRFWLDSKINQ